MLNIFQKISKAKNIVAPNQFCIILIIHTLFGFMYEVRKKCKVSPRPATSFLRSKYFVSTGGY
jgi:hypothetical protein